MPTRLRGGRAARFTGQGPRRAALEPRRARLAAPVPALSVDHLEHLDAEGVRAIAQAGSVAVLLPGAFYFMAETQKPPVELLRAAGVPMAVASDLNPGTSPLASLRLMLNMAATLFGLTPEESLVGGTRGGASPGHRQSRRNPEPSASRPISLSGTSKIQPN